MPLKMDLDIRKSAGFLLLFSIMPAIAAAQTLVSAPTSQSFGQVVANGGTAAQSIGFVLSGATTPTFSLAYGAEYSISTPQCSGSGNINCSVPVSFQPRFAGLRQDALVAKDGNGNVIGTTFLYGIGQGPMSVLSPGVISTSVGTGGWSFSGDGGSPAAATLANPQAMAVDNAGNLYIADSINQVVREVSASTGRISTVVGKGYIAGYTGDGGPAAGATLNNPMALAFDGAGNLYIADQGNNVIRKVSAASGRISTVAGGGTAASGPDGLGNGGPATSALLSGPSDVAIDGGGNLFIADSYNGMVRRVDVSSGNISVVVSGLRSPAGVAVDPAGNLYIADSGNSVIRRLDASSHALTVVAGNGSYGYTGNLGPAVNAELGTPVCVRLDAAGNLYIADQAENVIRQVNAQSGIITTIAGTGAPGSFGNGGNPASAALRNPTGVGLDSTGNIYIADNANNMIRKISQPNGFAFANTLVGEASAPQQWTVSNIGNQPLSFSGLNISSNFAQESIGATICSSSSVLTSAASCTIAVAFVPTTSGNLSGILSVTTNSRNVAGTAQCLGLTGTGMLGAVPQLSFSPSSLTFAAQATGTSSSVQSIILSNPGAAPLNISSIQLTGKNAADFRMTATCPTVLAANASCSINISFVPTGTGARCASLIVTDNLSNSPQTVTITGSGGAPQVAMSANTLTFGSQPVGAASAAKVITISNTGSGTLNIVSMTVSGSNAADFALTNTCGASVAAAASCSVSLTFAPKVFGLRTAVLTLTDNAAGSSQTISLSGTGSVWATPTVFRPSNGTWYRLPASGTAPVSTQWGGNGDIPVPGDYDGDGKTDIAVFRPSNGTWYIIYSHNWSTYTLGWGGTGDIPVPGDYDGDGKTDIAVFRPSNGTWYIISSHNFSSYTVAWGGQGYVPVPGDYDGDGKTDIAVFAPSNGTWSIIYSHNWSTYTLGWGGNSDIPVPGDYDGDGKTDIAVFRPSNGTWYIISSHNFSSYTVAWGGQGYVPVPADYDGDGKTDIAVFAPSNGSWSTILSQSWSVSSPQVGIAGDTAIAGFSR